LVPRAVRPARAVPAVFEPPQVAKAGMFRLPPDKQVRVRRAKAALVKLA
jgi:hypothetical protein